MVEKRDIVDALSTVHDPEIPVNVWDLGLVYDIEVQDRSVEIEMTLTSPTCPIAGQILGRAERAVEAVDGVEEANAELVWDPPWSPEKASDEGKLKLRSMGISIGGSHADEEADDGTTQSTPGSAF